ncbi:diguanylate cyclase domain-containing protein [Sphingosinicella soli]|uniref:Diguanylate cyclase (GGDEF)-like protein/PAS domain S-box-containing protein n=1 Tax=Sphingosinicella soli TaxID=333708 RepID=A0A7W7F5X1_9SPHN|nr:diguanylate cyclase [Sphingosinicella soli]MBB4631895.1 diguanylate cyclase (GGDEF)-like protein/PAS domain S-box-containing protein [Sphingosinicella soli]
MSGKVSEIKAFPPKSSDSREDELLVLRAELAREKALRQRYETQLRQLSASLPMVIWMADERRNVTFISDNWYDLTGTNQHDLGNWITTVHLDDRRRVVEELVTATDRRERYAVEYRTQRADGSIAWVLNMGAPRFNENGAYDGYVGAVIDVSERRAATETLQGLETRLSLALDGTRVGVWDWDITSGDVWLSDSALGIQGYAKGEVKGHASGIAHYVHPDDLAELHRAMTACLKGDQPMVNLEHRLRGKDGGWVWVAERGRVVERDANGRALRMIGTRTDMTEQRERDDRLRWLAAHDVLTELPNRGRFQELLLATMRETDARGGRMALMLVDLDHFKGVNDSFGHDVGDALLRRTARRLRDAFSNGCVARLGGDEFAIIVPDAGRHGDDVMTLAEKAIYAGTSGGDPGESTASVGVALYPDHAATATELSKAADVALYAAKQAGRACVRPYEPRR